MGTEYCFDLAQFGTFFFFFKLAGFNDVESPLIFSE